MKVQQRLAHHTRRAKTDGYTHRALIVLEQSANPQVRLVVFRSTTFETVRLVRLEVRNSDNVTQERIWWEITEPQEVANIIGRLEALKWARI